MIQLWINLEDLYRTGFTIALLVQSLDRYSLA